MHGQGYAPPQPQGSPPAGVIVLRVLFALLPVLSCGMLAWATMLRLAFVTRRTRDWVLSGVAVVLLAGCFAVLMTDSTEDLSTRRSSVSILTLLVAAVCVVTYYLYSDVTHYSALRARQSPAYFPPAPPQFGYGYPPQVPQPQQTAHPQQGPAPVTAGYPQPVPPAHYPQPVPPHYPQSAGPPHYAQQPQLPPQPEAQHSDSHPRIDQVRAELDELSDMLRKEQGNH